MCSMSEIGCGNSMPELSPDQRRRLGRVYALLIALAANRHPETDLSSTASGLHDRGIQPKASTPDEHGQNWVEMAHDSCESD